MTSTIQRYQPPANGGRTAVSQATSIEQSRAIADVQAAVTVAQNCPRDMAEAEREMEYVCSRLDMAEKAFYAVTNRGTGPSVHLMRELARIWGNVDYGVKELNRSDNKGESEVLATCWDMQKNTRSSRTFIVPHQRMARGSRVDLVDLTDIYLNNQNVGARAVRECIQTILPSWFTEKAQQICKNTIAHGDGEPLQDRINTMVDWFRDKLGVTQQQLEARLEKKRGTWTPDDVAQMKIAGKSIMAGEASRDELFPPTAAADIVTDPCEDDVDQVAAKPLRGKVKSAKGGAGQGGGNDQGEGVEPSSGTTRVDPPGDQDAKDPAAEPPGAPTAGTPGQTDRVAKALGNARKGGMPAVTRGALTDDILDRLNSAGCNNDADRRTVTAHILEVGPAAVTNLDDLNDSGLTKVRDALHAWQQLGTAETMVSRILDAADLNAEQQGAQQEPEQPTLDTDTQENQE